MAKVKQEENVTRLSFKFLPQPLLPCSSSFLLLSFGFLTCGSVRLSFHPPPSASSLGFHIDLLDILRSHSCGEGFRAKNCWHLPPSRSFKPLWNSARSDGACRGRGSWGMRADISEHPVEQWPTRPRLRGRRPKSWVSKWWFSLPPSFLPTLSWREIGSRV